MSNPASNRLPSIHHVAFACRDPQATDRFYGELLGLPLVNTEVQKMGNGYLKHMFYDTGDGSCIAFFYLHGLGEPSPLKTAISTDLGLPKWVNHFAFRVHDEAEADATARRLVEGGFPMEMEIDHGWCVSRYFPDPNGILVELCRDRPGLPVDEPQARALMLADPLA